MGLPAEKQRYTVAEYLRLERESPVKHEFRDGCIIAMAGGTVYHSRVIANTSREIGNRLEGTPCGVFESNLRVRAGRSGLYTYPDITVICGAHEVDDQDPQGETVTNPRVIVEVLSFSTEGYDRGEKFTRYRELTSLDEYVLVTPWAPRVETFLRQPDGMWILAAFAGLEAIVKIRSLKIEIPLAKLYLGVIFPPQEEIDAAFAAAAGRQRPRV